MDLAPAPVERPQRVGVDHLGDKSAIASGRLS
jgi:hypothetical protein